MEFFKQHKPDHEAEKTDHIETEPITEDGLRGKVGDYIVALVKLQPEINKYLEIIKNNSPRDTENTLQGRTILEKIQEIQKKKKKLDSIIKDFLKENGESAGIERQQGIYEEKWRRMSTFESEIERYLL